MQGRFTDAHIELEHAYAQIEGNGQENMALCCDFLARRLSLHMDMEQRDSFEERREALLRVVQEDAGILLASVAPDAVLKTLA